LYSKRISQDFVDQLTVGWFVRRSHDFFGFSPSRPGALSSRRTGHVCELSILVYEEKVMRVVEVSSREIFGGKLELKFVVADRRGFERRVSDIDRRRRTESERCAH
jgi:hypothetical protein